MSDPFGLYSSYYDVLYQDKNYEAESAYILSLLNSFGDHPIELLELGCGTGKHGELLARSGMRVTGVERSPEMYDRAIIRSLSVEPASQANATGSLHVLLGDAKAFRSETRYDAVLALFHVVSYQTTNEDVAAMFETAALHLKPSGIFLFDVWYGPAVLSERPAVRVKRMSSDAIDVLRIAEPVQNVNRNCVDVHYEIIVTDRETGRVSRFSEHHLMRYYFTPELEWIAERNGLKIVHQEEWLSGAAPSCNTWGITFVAKKIN